MDTPTNKTSPWRYPNLGAAHAAAIGLIGTVAESGTNNFHKYDYATAGDLSRACGSAMAATGLSLARIGMEVSREELDADRKGNKRWLHHVRCTYRFLHESGEFLEVVSYGTGIDSEDKGFYKAFTGCWKYLLRQLFCIATGDDPEEHRPTEEELKAREEREMKAREEAYAEGRRSAVRALAIYTTDPDYKRDKFDGRLADAGYSDPSLVAEFCVWAGLRKPSQQSQKVRDSVIARLLDPKGAKRFREFLADTGRA